MRKRILFITPLLNYGGAAKMLAALANYLASQDYIVYIYTYERNVINQPLDTKIVHIKYRRQFKLRGFRRLMQTIDIRKTIRDFAPDFVISFTDYPNLLTLLASIGINVPVVISERGNPYISSKGWFHRFKRYMYRFADGIVFQTEGARAFYCKSIQKKSTIIPNPVLPPDIDFQGIVDRKNEIVSVGRFETFTKRQDLLIKAFKKVLDKFPETKLVFYGDGPDQKKVEAMVHEIGIDNNVVFAGVTTSIYESIRLSKIFVLSSDYEGIPNALIEAMSVGLPCVSTDCSPGGARILIDHMKNGILVPCGDADALADAIIMLLGNKNLSDQIGAEAKKIIKKFEPERIYGLWKEFIEGRC